MKVNVYTCVASPARSFSGGIERHHIVQGGEGYLHVAFIDMVSEGIQLQRPVRNVIELDHQPKVTSIASLLCSNEPTISTSNNI